MSEGPRPITGRARERTTRRSVLVMDKLSRAVITVGGIGTIVAVLFILVFLITVTAPLFGGADVEATRSVTPEATQAAWRPLRVRIDDFGIVSWELDTDGVLRVRRLDSGDVIEEKALFDAGSVTALSQPVRENKLALGLSDGSVVLGTIEFETTFREPDAADVPEALRGLREGEIGIWDGGVVQRTPAGQLRRQKVKTTLADPLMIDADSPIALIDRTDMRAGPTFTALTADGVLHIRVVKERPNLMTGEIRRKVKGADVQIERRPGQGLPTRLLLSGLADNVYLTWEDGLLLRYGIRDLENPEKIEARDLLPDPSARIVDLVPLVGKSTFLVADNQSGLRSFFLSTTEESETSDGMSLLPGPVLDVEGAEITSLTTSLRSRTVAAGSADGHVRLYFVTSRKLLADVRSGEEEPIEAIALSPRDDALLALSGRTWHRWTVDMGHPEATIQSLLGKLHYEGYEWPEYVWQSSGATDAAEMKLGLVPLIFGTVKATLFSMLFAVPLALLAALYTSEFLNPRIRPRVKAVVEVMASLPSVVLGFIAAFVLAPFVEKVVPTVLLAFVTIPFAFLLGAYLWQLVPRRVALGLERYRLAFIASVVPLGLLLAVALAPALESVFFGGDLKAWLDGQVGSAVGGWTLILLPFAVLGVSLFGGAASAPLARGMSEGEAGIFSLGRFLAIGVVGLLLAWGVGALLGWASLDPRHGLVGTYGQRNAMVVGFAMGFAVIPIIYTLAEDALASVPQHLRAASLGAGATPWQTAIRIVAPTAASGIFSAIMIGLGRAVGETMIVLMAAGNTAIMDWNPFNGFQTLSAAIATEMPEAVRGSTHFRVLFLAGLALFAMTFVINTAAEIVRLRFRKKAVQL